MENQNTLVELNNILFEELRSLKGSTWKGDMLQNQINKANAVAKLSQAIVKNADVLLKAQCAESERLACCQGLPEMLKIEGTKELKK